MSSVARQDLRDIADYIARASGEVRSARSFARELLDRCARLAALPGVLGVHRPGYGPDLRVTFHRQYVLVFRYEGVKLILLRVIEGHRDVSNQFQPDET